MLANVWSILRWRVFKMCPACGWLLSHTDTDPK